MIIRSFCFCKTQPLHPNPQPRSNQRVTIDAVCVTPNHWLTELNLIEQGDMPANMTGQLTLSRGSISLI
jgi:hypothetical protein